MIISLLINFIAVIFGTLFSLLPLVSISSIPVVGVDMAAMVLVAASYFNAFMDTFPYAQPVWWSFITIIVPLEILLLVAKFFLGNRLPTNVR